MLTKKELPDCAVTSVIELIGNKWKLLILKRLHNGPVRFNELSREIPGISQKVLSDNLKALEADCLIIRTVYPEIPPHVEYSLSEIGLTLKPLFKSMAEWGSSYKENINKKKSKKTDVSA